MILSYFFLCTLVSAHFLCTHRMFLNFNAWFILGPGVFAAASAQSNTIDAISHVRGEVGYQFVLFGRCSRREAPLSLSFLLLTSMLALNSNTY